MAPQLGLFDVYHILAALFQLLLALLILRAGRPDPVRNGFVLVLAISGLENLDFLAGDLDLLAPGTSLVAIFTLDTILLWTLVFLATQLPRPIGGQQGARLARRLWIGTTVALVPICIGIGLLRVAPQVQPYSDDLGSLVHEPPFLLVAALLALWCIPQWQRLAPGPLRGLGWLAIAGVGVSTFFQQGAWLTSLFVDPLLGQITCNPGRSICMELVLPVATWFGLATLGLLAVKGTGHGSRDGTYLAGALLLAMLMGVWFKLIPDAGGAEVATQVLRPLLIAAAMLRYDLFQLPRPSRRWLLPTAVLCLAGLAFLLVGLTLQPGQLEAQALDPLPAMVALLAALGVTIALHRPLSVAVSHDPRGPSRLERLDRYRLALERGGRPTAPSPRPADAELTQLRAELGITPEEHDVLTTILSHHMLVPTRAVAGLEPGMQVAHRYTVREELGRGGFGRALLATDEETGEEVVLKELLRPWEDVGRDRGRASLEREAALADLDLGEHVAQVHAIVEAGYTTYLVREHVPGRPLDEVLATEGGMPVHRAVDVIDGILAGVHALHDHGLLHLDLKPANIILTPAGRPVLIDVGQSDRQDHEVDLHATATLVSATSPVGTPAWMAPEQVLGEPVGPRTDLFAVGALLHRLLTGLHHVPLEGASAYEIEDAIVRGSPPRLDDQVPASLGHVVEQALARDPEERFQSAQAFRDALSGAARDASP